MRKRPAVALLIETSNAYARGLLAGIIAWQRTHDAWSIYLPEQERGAVPPQWLSRWKGDGIIARIETDEIAKAVRRCGVPVVDVSAARRLKNIPWVETDDQLIAAEAFRHLSDRGLKNFAFCGDPGFNWSVWRRDRFCRLVADAGGECHVHDSIPQFDHDFSWTREQKRMTQWLRGLPRPIGIFAAYDIKAQQLLEVCRDEGISVPEEVSVVGVDDDELICELSHPPLSSIVPNTRRTGYEAAALLDRMMTGEECEEMMVLIPPLGVTTRQSTDVLAIEDPEVASALRFIREHACQGIDVADVLRNVPLSRRMLETRFAKILGRTPHAEIARLRIERAKRLLTETDLPLAEIAELAGFQHNEYFSVAFKREVGRTPSTFRRVSRR
ncbi:MAG: DNA-binding transcriptional regulator [Planctomycetaceae bacterium]